MKELYDAINDLLVIKDALRNNDVVKAKAYLNQAIRKLEKILEGERQNVHQ